MSHSMPHLHSVSIHAPTGGATANRPSLATLLIGFNPRAHGRRDTLLANGEKITFSFNPRAHGRRDRGQVDAQLAGGVSIHAPTGGATWALVLLP